MDAHRNGTKTIYCLYKNPLIHLCFSTGTHRCELLSTTILYRGSHQDTLRIIQMFRKKRYVHPFISRKPVRTPLTYIQIDQICRIELGIFAVALLAEGVDRNHWKDGVSSMSSVALLAEGVDRNEVFAPLVSVVVVALLAEGVDRNRAAGRDEPTGYSRPPRGGRG